MTPSSNSSAILASLVSPSFATTGSGFHLSVYLINFYSKTGSLSDARYLFDEIPFKSMFSWNSILSMYAKGGQFDTASGIFDRMRFSVLDDDYHWLQSDGSARKNSVDVLRDDSGNFCFVGEKVFKLNVA